MASLFWYFYSMKSKTLFVILGITLGLLAVPAIAMFFSDEVNWGPGDFVVAGLLIFGLGTAIALARKKAKRHPWVIVLIVLFFLLLWAELAVGVFGSPIAGD